MNKIKNKRFALINKKVNAGILGHGSTINGAYTDAAQYYYPENEKKIKGRKTLEKLEERHQNRVKALKNNENLGCIKISNHFNMDNNSIQLLEDLKVYS